MFAETGRKGEPSVDYFKRVVGNADLAAELEEAVAVRDAVVHNHIWWTLVGEGPDGHLKFWGRPSLRKGYGDQRFRRVRRRGTLVTRRLGLDLFPTRIDRRDAHLVVKTVARCLRGPRIKEARVFPDSGYAF